MIIESRANERVKEARKLLLRKERKETGLHLIESEKLVREAVASRAVPGVDADGDGPGLDAGGAGFQISAGCVSKNALAMTK